MAKSKLVVLALAAAISISPMQAKAGLPMVIVPPGSTMSGAGAYALAGCVAGIILAAIDAGRRFNRELTPAEAASCGLLYWANLANLRP